MAENNESFNYGGVIHNSLFESSGNENDDYLSVLNAGETSSFDSFCYNKHGKETQDLYNLIPV